MNNKGASGKPDRAVVNGAGQAVSAVPASVPSAADIPAGLYCYTSLSEMDKAGRMKVLGPCPFYASRPGEHAYCGFLDYETISPRELLWDQVKICGENEGGYDAPETPPENRNG